MLPRHLLVVTSIVSLASLICASLYDDTANLELERYIEEVKIIHEQLIELGCQDPDLMRLRRELLSPSTDEVKLRMKKKLYERLIDMLVKCEHQQLQAKAVSASTSRSATATTTTPTTIPTTTPTATPTTTPTQKITTTTTPAPSSTLAPTTTTAHPQPVECQNAINLTESWRQEHKGKNLKPKNGNRNCDPQDMVVLGRPWFRFSGAAGNRMLNKCVGGYSCGTGAPLWTDHTMPSQVGFITSITLFGNSRSSLSSASCRAYKKKASVMKCSLKENDYVYRYDDLSECTYGFCGMS